MSRHWRTAAAVAALGGLLGCSGSLNVARAPLPDAPSEATLHDFRTAPLQESTGFSLSQSLPVQPSQTPDWDFVYYVTAEGTPQFRPRGMVLNDSSDAGIQRVQQTFDGLTEAPSGGYSHDAAVKVVDGAVYAVVSERDPGYTTVRCRYYAKIQVTAVDPQAGTVDFQHLVNPNCEDRVLVPGPRQ